MCGIICQRDKHLHIVIVTKSSTYDLGKVPNILLRFIYLTIMLTFNENAKLLRSALIMCCVIWHHLKNFKNVKNTHGEVTLLHGCFSHFLNCTDGDKSPNQFAIQNFCLAFRLTGIHFLGELGTDYMENFTLG